MTLLFSIDLSGDYDLMCADIDYQAQSRYVRRLHQFFGNEEKRQPLWMS